MGARPYDPAIGRFLAVDPVDGGSLNNYDYAGQDPVNNSDLDGTMLAADQGGGGTHVIYGNQCGAFGWTSCIGMEGDASDPIFSTKSVIINIGLFAIPGAGELVFESRAAKAANILGKNLAAGRLARAAIAADEASGMLGPGASTSQTRVVAAGAFLKALVGDSQPSLIRLRKILGLPYRGGSGWIGFP